MKLHLIALAFVVAAPAQSTSFSYQGELKENGAPANCSFNMEFRLFNALSGGAQFGPTVTMNGVTVANGVFTEELDFGVTPFNNLDRWLEIKVNGFTLSPRTKITRSPYSLQTRGIYVDDNRRVGVGHPDPQAELHVGSQGTGSGTPSIRIGDNDSSYTTLRNSLFHEASLQKHKGSGYTSIDLSPVIGDGAGDAAISFFGHTNTTGDRGVTFFRGDGAAFSSAFIGLDGRNSFFQRFGGNFGIGTPTPESRLDVAGDSKFRNRLGVGNPAGAFGQFSIADSGDGSTFALDASWDNDNFPTLFASNAGSGGVLWAQGANDATLGGGGVIVIGDQAGENLAIDGNEIMARDNGAAATLHLNAEGGPVKMGANVIYPAIAHGVIRPDGTVLSSTPNLVSVSRPEEGTYYLQFNPPLLETDVPLVSTHYVGTLSIHAAAAESNGQLIVTTVRDGSKIDGTFSFVVFGP